MDCHFDEPRSLSMLYSLLMLEQNIIIYIFIAPLPSPQQAFLLPMSKSAYFVIVLAFYMEWKITTASVQNTYEQIIPL